MTMPFLFFLEEFMKIIVQNYVGKDYRMFSHTMAGITQPFIGSSQEVIAHELSPICVYNSDLPDDSTDLSKNDDDLPIYAKFAFAEDIQEIINFFNTYGSIISPSLVSNQDTDTHCFPFAEDLAKISNETQCDHSSFYECMSLYHYRYYQYEMKYLILIQQLLSNNNLTDVSSIKLLVDYCSKLVFNPYFDPMFCYEYNGIIDNEKYTHYFSFNPYMTCLHNISLIRNHENSAISSFLPDESHDFILRIFMGGRGKIDDNSYKANKDNIVNLAKYLFSSALSFEIRETYPIVNYGNTDLSQDWHFSSLINALFFSFYLDYSPTKVIAHCANESCNKIFTFTKTRRNKKYCCYNCAHIVSNRRYRKHLKEKQEQQKTQEQQESLNCSQSPE